MGLFDSFKSESSAPASAKSAEGLKSAFGRAFDAQGLKYQDVSRNGIQALRVGFTLDNWSNIEVFHFFDDDGTSYQIRSGVIMHVDDNKRSAVLELMNRINSEYRWLRFYLDDDSDLIAQQDIDVLQMDNELPVVVCLRAAKILDDVYPEFMKTKWA